MRRQQTLRVRLHDHRHLIVALVQCRIESYLLHALCPLRVSVHLW